MKDFSFKDTRKSRNVWIGIFGLGAALDVSKNQLASLLGTIPETLSRILARMARDSFIALSGQRRIRLLDRKGLEELASGERRLN